jgi:biopolymer transport protein ExbD
VVVLVVVACTKEAPPPAQSVKVQFPRARSGGGEVTIAQVRLEPGGVVQLDGAAVKLDELSERLRAIRAQTPSVEVHFSAAGEVPYEKVIEALDAAHRAGIMDISFDSADPKVIEAPQKRP